MNISLYVTPIKTPLSCWISSHSLNSQVFFWEVWETPGSGWASQAVWWFDYIMILLWWYHHPSLVIQLYHDFIMMIPPSACESTLSWFHFLWWYHHPTGDDVWRLSTISIIMTVAGHPPRADDWWTRLAADWREERSIREEGEWQHYFIIKWFMMTRILLFLPLKKIT